MNDNLTIASILANFRSGTMSPVEVLENSVARIDSLNSRINALTALCIERARQEAKASEKRYRRGDALPLDGIPFVAKDLLDTANVETTYGSVLYRGHVPREDAEAVGRLRNAGAILVGKSATHEFGWGLTTTSALHGPTRNPWDLTRVPGGSSGGSAAALAVDLVPLALGSDTGGSIRIPSAFCGTAGIKPTRNRVPMEGAFALASSLDHVGPMARTAEDLSLAMAVLDGTYGSGVREQEVNPKILNGLRILVIDDLHPVALTEDISRVFAEACGALSQHGARIIDKRWSDTERPDPYGILAPTLNAEARLRHEVVLGHYPQRAAEYSPDVCKRIELAAQYGLREYIEAAQRRAAFTAQFVSVFAEGDVLLSPVSAVSAVKIGTDTVIHDGKSVELRSAIMGYIAPQSLSGLPAAVIRAGFDRHEMPVGIQLTMAAGSDHRLIEIAAALETVLGATAVGGPNHSIKVS
ncbi:amidase [Ensifer adhaerens]|uniref:amidase n=1 Tax=Ensifer adhaerens TaxID=106592 RepID=UPI001CBBDB2E|nr:amidase [Ensifer adhaerens]MBZ7924806.1 amidase [Ensifer adhaerens]UAX95972.1 amidase [Ensifer adhaerens]UAY04686.1 amidase [Ensifer adhaerens]UAY10117.1 amidase [Ensifer adhaerens]